jgi:hypothetical protein
MSAKKAHRIPPHAKPSARNRGPVGALAIGLFLVGVVAVLLLQSPKPPAPSTATGAGQPQLVVDQDRIDFGAVPVNQMVKASFKLTNAGNQPLTLTVPPVAKVVEGC